MSASIRPFLSWLAVAFTVYLTIGGLLWTTPGAVQQPVVAVASLALYLLTALVCIFWPAPTATVGDGPAGELTRPSPLPLWTTVLALGVAVIVPNATWLSVEAASRSQSFATWGLGGIGALMAILVVRGRVWFAWAGVAIVVGEAIFWIGVADAVALGAVGAVLWVGIAHLVTGLVGRAARDTAELTQLQRAASEWLASQEGGRRERRAQVQRALAIAGPVLARVVEADGRLSDAEREQAHLAEGALRDELRASRLLDDEVRAQLDAARRRGAVVSVTDEGGLDDLDVETLTEIRARLAAALTDTSSEQVFVRTSTHGDTAVTVVGRSRGGDGEDVVDLWHEIERTTPVFPGRNAAGDGAAAGAEEPAEPEAPRP
ncbi:hypothetical protein [Microbacterium telephonicum]|uniref:Signal transduction histidine kinase n=1 Tax=Microbacterium telephonicum TaxID=1714841 RepID=A0A498BY62_9MICO|nr:hypothetical protein [Microbacterium telephonicum]RLK47777.1 hypothetical protein C7474_2374 [Microbacterium telephonicum]